MILWEFDPRTKDRSCYENGKFIDNPPFGGARVVRLPEPISTRAYAKNVGIPMSVGAQMMAKGLTMKKGVDGVESMLPAQELADELRKRDIVINEAKTAEPPAWRNGQRMEGGTPFW